MLAYEFFWFDETGEVHLIGMLPERRRNPRRITQESVMEWGRTLFGDNPALKDFVISEVNIDEDTYRITRVAPFSRD